MLNNQEQTEAKIILRKSILKFFVVLQKSGAKFVFEIAAVRIFLGRLKKASMLFGDVWWHFSIVSYHFSLG